MDIKVRKVGATHVVTLPKALRERFGLKAGDRAVIEETRAGLLIRAKTAPQTCSKCGLPTPTGEEWPG